MKKIEEILLNIDGPDFSDLFDYISKTNIINLNYCDNELRIKLLNNCIEKGLNEEIVLEKIQLHKIDNFNVFFNNLLLNLKDVDKNNEQFFKVTEKILDFIIKNNIKITNVDIFYNNFENILPKLSNNKNIILKIDKIINIDLNYKIKDNYIFLSLIKYNYLDFIEKNKDKIVWNNEIDIKFKDLISSLIYFSADSYNLLNFVKSLKLSQDYNNELIHHSLDKILNNMSSIYNKFERLNELNKSAVNLLNNVEHLNLIDKNYKKYLEDILLFNIDHPKLLIDNLKDKSIFYKNVLNQSFINVWIINYLLFLDKENSINNNELNSFFIKCRNEFLELDFSKEENKGLLYEFVFSLNNYNYKNYFAKTFKEEVKELMLKNNLLNNYKTINEKLFDKKNITKLLNDCKNTKNAVSLITFLINDQQTIIENNIKIPLEIVNDMNLCFEILKKYSKNSERVSLLLGDSNQYLNCVYFANFFADINEPNFNYNNIYNLLNNNDKKNLSEKVKIFIEKENLKNICENKGKEKNIKYKI